MTDSNFNQSVLLLAQSYVTMSGVGELFLKDALRCLEGHNIVRFYVVSCRRRSDLEQFRSWQNRNGSSTHIRLSPFPLLSTYYHLRDVRSIPSQTLMRIRELIDDQHIDRIWIVLNSPYMISLAKALSLTNSIQISVMIWDMPEYMIRTNKLNAIVGNAILRDFGVVLRRSDRVSTISESMRDWVKDRYGRDSLIIRHGMDRCSIAQERPMRDQSVLTIGFAGNLYANDCWNSLLSSLSASGAQIGGRPIRIIHMGRFPRFGAKRSDFVSFMGVVPFGQVMETMRLADVAYLPYWFKRSCKFAARMSFPGKLSAYVASRTPILFHGPAYSAAVQFINKYRVGVCCHSLRQDSILDAITKTDALNGDPALWRSQTDALDQELGYRVMAERLHEFLKNNLD